MNETGMSQAARYTVEITELFAILRDKWPMIAAPENLETPISYVVPLEDLRVLQARIEETIMDWGCTVDVWIAKGGANR